MATITETLFTDKLNTLKALLFKFDKTHHTEKINLLKELIINVPIKANSVLQFHQVLMGMLAYPGNQQLLNATEETTLKLLKLVKENKSLQEKLSGTGLLHTNIACNFTYAKALYITQAFPNEVSIHSASSDIETQKAVLKVLLPKVEYSNIHEGNSDIKTRIARFNSSTKTTDLECLLQCIEQSKLDIKTQAFLYNQLGIFIQWNVGNEKDSVSFLRGNNRVTYFHNKPLHKKVSINDIIKQPLPLPIKLNDKQKEQLIHSAKMSLLYLYRETEPFTNANAHDLTLFELENGISVALFGSTVDKRYSLESYIGYLVLKNNIPASYGGGWLFGERSQFGINILEPFRGGESALIICELLRVYHQHFGATRFVVKPYQFGLNNPEAIKTGAFWFYYKLGFRPEDATLKELAYKEEQAKQSDPSYKSEASTLKRYTKSNLVLNLSDASYPEFDAEELSKKITDHINTTFSGDREAAITHCFKQLKKHTGINFLKWNADDVEYAKQMSLLFNLYPNHEAWMANHKQAIEKFILLKSAKTELPWIKHLQSFSSFWKMNEKIGL